MTSPLSACSSLLTSFNTDASDVPESRSEPELGSRAGPGIETLIIEPVEDDATFPYARVIETHRDLLAMLFDNSDDDEVEDEHRFEQSKVNFERFLNDESVVRNEHLVLLWGDV